MPIFITQGRYTREAVRGMIDKPEDRAEALSRLMSKAGARLIGYYITFGEYDFLTVAEAPSEIKTNEKPIINATEFKITRQRTRARASSLRISSRETPDTNER